MRARLAKLALLVPLALGGCEAKQGEECEEQGDCQGDLWCYNHICKPQEDAHAFCKEHEMCPQAGHCAAALPNRCVATEEEHCLSSDICASEGRCKRSGTQCVKDDEVVQ